MADGSPHSSRSDNKRKYGETSPAPPRRVSGFSSPVPSSNPPADGIQLAKQRAQEIAARLLIDAEAKRPRVENGGPGDDYGEKNILQKPTSQPLQSSLQSTGGPPSYGSYGYGAANKRIEIPNGRVGVIIGKAGETIKYLQLQSGAKIQVTRDAEADPYSQTRIVELTGTSEQVSKAEQLITDVLKEAEAGGSGIGSARKYGGVQPGTEQFIMKVPNNKVGLVIGKGGETIKSMQAKTGARVQIIPLHLPPGDTSTERTVQIDGTSEQIELAKQLVNEVISDNRMRTQSASGGYNQPGYGQPRPTTSWAPPGPPPVQPPSYGYMQAGAYPGPPPPYSTSQPTYATYPTPSSGGYSSGWDHSSGAPSQQTAASTGYDYYSQQQPQQQQQQQLPPPPPIPVSSAPDASSGYSHAQYSESSYSQPPAVQPQGYSQDGGYSSAAYSSGPQTGYTSAPTSQPAYDQSYGYDGSSAPPVYSTQPVSAGQGPSSVPPPAPTQQLYSSQQPATAPTGYSHQASGQQTGYGQPPSSQPGYSSQAPPAGYGQPGYAQKAPSPAQPGVYGQAQPISGGYGQPPATQTGYNIQQDTAHPRSASGGYGQPQPGYGGPPQGQPAAYSTQQQPPSYESYGYSQPPQGYSTDGSAVGGGAPHASFDPNAAQAAAKAPQS